MLKEVGCGGLNPPYGVLPIVVGGKCFPSSLNLRLSSIFFELERKMINSVLVKLRDKLLAFSY